MRKTRKIQFDYHDITEELTLEDIVALITTGNRTSPEYGLTLMILQTIANNPQGLEKAAMYDLYMRNREAISKASFYRILKRLQEKGMVLLDNKKEVYTLSIYFSNALHKLAAAWEEIVVKKAK